MELGKSHTNMHLKITSFCRIMFSISTTTDIGLHRSPTVLVTDTVRSDPFVLDLGVDGPPRGENEGETLCDPTTGGGN